MADTQQTYANHTRWHPPFHFFILPVMLINLIWSIVECFRHPGWNEGWWVVVSLALLLLTFLTRLNALKAQDRIIRLEERLRYQRLFSADLALEAGSLRAAHIIALRFAADEELEGLVRQVLAGRLTKPAEIKQAIKHWRSDTFRV